MKTTEEKIKMIREDPDFINCPDADNSLKKFVTSPEFKDPSSAAICRLLLISEEEVNKIYIESIKQLKNLMQ